MNENWEFNLLIGDGDVTYYNKFPLVFVPGTQERYKLEQSGGTGNQTTGSISGQQPLVLNHVSDDSPPRHARLIEANKLGQWRLSVFDDENATPEWNTILSNVHALNRHMSGATSTAARYNIDGTAERVRFEVIPQGGISTYFTVQSGFANSSQSYYTKASQQSDSTIASRAAWFIPLNFTFTEAGEGDVITLRNSLASSPHFVEFNTSATLADGWNLIGTPTETKDTSTFLIGGSSQKFITDNSTGEGIESDAVTASTSTNAVAFAWVATDGNAADDLTVELEDGSNNSIDTTVISFNADGTESSSVSDQYRVGSDGSHWYRVVVSGTNSTAANFVLRVYRASGDATQISTYFVDGCYLQTNTLTAPLGWCSTSSLKNRYDPSIAEGNINYQDVALLPGDLPAIITSDIDETVTGGGRKILYAAQLNNQPNDLVGSIHYMDVTNIPVLANSTGTWTTGTGTIENFFRRCTTATGTLGDGASWANATAIYRRNWRVFGICRADNLNATFQVSIVTFDIGAPPLTPVGTLATYFTSEALSVSVINTWEVLDFGLYVSLPITQAISTLPKVDIAANTGNADIDGLIFLPVASGDGFVVADGGPIPFGTSVTGWELDGVNERVVANTGATPGLGELYRVKPGQEMTRFIMFATDNADAIDITEEYNIDLSIIPRSSHLLGTQ